MGPYGFIFMANNSNEHVRLSLKLFGYLGRNATQDMPPSSSVPKLNVLRDEMFVIGRFTLLFHNPNHALGRRFVSANLSRFPLASFTGSTSRGTAVLAHVPLPVPPHLYKCGGTGRTGSREGIDAGLIPSS